MDAYFTALTKRQAMLLLTGVTFGGQDVLGALDHLPEEDAELLKERAQAILGIPRETRVPFLVQEIKRLVTARRIDDLRSADPRRLAEALRPERPAMIEVLLCALPASFADRVREELGLSAVKLSREVHPEILSVIRWAFERRIEAMAPKRVPFKLSDLFVLAGRELWALCDCLGAKALATAVAGLPQTARDEFLKSLPADQRALCAKAAAAATGRRLESADAREVIQGAVAGRSPSDAVRHAGVRRLARAARSQSPDFAAQLLDRHKNDFGKAFGRGLREEEKQPARRGDELLAEEVLMEIERLADRGVVERPLRLAPPPGARRSAAVLPARAAEDDDDKTELSPPRHRPASPGPGRVVEMPAVKIPGKPKPRGSGRGGG